MQQRPAGLGAEGEARAAAYLERLGYRVLERNARAGGVELDLIVQRGATLVFVEVKTRSNARHGTPEEAVDARKQARIVRGAGAWLRAHPRRVRRVRFDVGACEASGTGQWQLRHWPGAFEAGS